VVVAIPSSGKTSYEVELEAELFFKPGKVGLFFSAFLSAFALEIKRVHAYLKVYAFRERKRERKEARRKRETKRRITDLRGCSRTRISGDNRNVRKNVRKNLQSKLSLITARFTTQRDL